MLAPTTTRPSTTCASPGSSCRAARSRARSWGRGRPRWDWAPTPRPGAPRSGSGWARWPASWPLAATPCLSWATVSSATRPKMPRQPSPSSPRHWAWSRSPAPHRHAPRTIAACERSSRADPGRNTCCCYAAADTPRPALPRPRHPDHRRGRVILEATRVGRVSRGDRSPPGDGGRGSLRTLGRGCPRTVVCGRVSSARRRGWGLARWLLRRRGGSGSPAMNFKLRIAIRLALGVALAVPAIARAAHGETPSAPAAAALTPPKLVTFVDAVYPAAAKAADAGEIVNVDLELTIDATGAVTEVHVATPVGDGFDEAALAAARRVVFEPARRGTQAIPARIKYRYAFQPPQAAPPPPTTGALEGRVLVRGADRPAVDTVVTVIGAGGEAHTVVFGL